MAGIPRTSRGWPVTSFLAHHSPGECGGRWVVWGIYPRECLEAQSMGWDYPQCPLSHFIPSEGPAGQEGAEAASGLVVVYKKEHLCTHSQNIQVGALSLSQGDSHPSLVATRDPRTSVLDTPKPLL